MAKKKIFELKSEDIFIRPDDIENLWDADWGIYVKDGEKQRVGSISFTGEKANGTVPMSITIDDIHDRNRGYGTQAIRTMVEWAFYHKSVFEITAVLEHENSAAIMAFQKAGFVFREGTRDIEHYSVTKPPTSWMGFYICIGIIIGLCLSLVIPSYPWVGFIIGVASSAAVGAGMDNKESSYRREITKESKYNK